VRLPEVFVRRSAHAEATLLKSRVKKAKHFATRERAAILRALNVGISVSQIVAMWMTDERHVRRIIDEFNERGMASLNPEYRGGRPRRIADDQRKRIAAVAGACPDTQGVAWMSPGPPNSRASPWKSSGSRPSVAPTARRFRTMA
jgi:hypothetical protein